MSPNSNPDIVVGSRTQTPESVQAALASMKFEPVQTETQTDAPPPAENAEKVDEPETPAAVEETPAVETDSASDPDAGSEAAGEGEEETPAGDPEPDAGQAAATDAEPPKEHKKKSGAARAKEKAARIASENEELKRRIAELEKRTAGPTESEIVVPEAKAKPTLDQFSDADDPYLAYQEALVDWKLETNARTALETQKTALKTKAQQEAEAQAKAHQEAAAQRWNEQVEIGKSRYQDFDEVMEKAQSIHAAIPLTDAVRTSDLMGLLGYYLATNPQELERLNQMLDLPANATQADYNKKMRLAYREVEKLEALVQNAAGTPETPAEEAETAPPAAAPVTPAAPAAPKPAAAAPAPKAPAVKPPAAPPKPKHEPVKPVGSRNASTRKTLQQMTKAEIHAMQQSDPDGFRELVLRSR